MPGTDVNFLPKTVLVTAGCSHVGGNRAGRMLGTDDVCARAEGSALANVGGLGS